MQSAPQSGDIFLRFDGVDDYVEIPSSPDFSIDTTGELSVAAWIRPDTLNFANEQGTGYVHWMGKGQADQQEWTFRMYSHKNSESPPRPNRISFYVFNPEGGLGVGSYVQEKVAKSQWMHIIGVAGQAQTFLYKNGSFRRCDTYRGPATGNCPIHRQSGSDEQLVITPQHGSAPLRIGTKDFGSFFKGGIWKIRIWNRVLDAAEVEALFASDDVSQGGLVAEYRFDQKTNGNAPDTAGSHDGVIVGATWARQR